MYNILQFFLELSAVYISQISSVLAAWSNNVHINILRCEDPSPCMDMVGLYKFYHATKSKLE